jgi:hypothetical protein
MIPMNIPRYRAFRASFLFFSLTLFLSLYSCGSKTITAFSWTSPEGKPLEFTQAKGFPEGQENRFGPGRERNSFRLVKPLTVPGGYMLAAEVNASVDGIVLGFSLGADLNKLGEEVRFAAPKGKTRFYLSLPDGRSLRALSLSIGAGSQEKTGDFEEWARLENLAILPAFMGFEEVKDGYRISDGISVKKSESSPSSISIRKSLANFGTGSSPVLVLRYRQRAELDIVIEAGTKILARCMSSNREVRIPLSALGNLETFPSIQITAPEAVALESAFIESASDGQATLTDPGTLLLGDGPGQGEEFLWYRWDLLPSVILFDFKDYAIQDAYLKRLAFFVEKNGFVGRLAPDQEIAPLHGWNAHDYKAEDLARFFALAEKQRFPLNQEELRLRDFLLERGVIHERAGGYGFSENAAIISISRESADYLRRTFLTHEASHALFFADSRYRAFCIELWNGMGEEEKWFWKLYFGWMNYNTASSYLMANEVQAYLVQQAPGRAGEYFTETLVGRLLENHPELEEKIAQYMEDYSGSFEQRAGVLDTWLRSNYGFKAGSIYFLR